MKTFSKKKKKMKQKWKILETLACSPKGKVNSNQSRSVVKVQLNSYIWFITAQFEDLNALFSTQKSLLSWKSASSRMVFELT